MKFKFPELPGSVETFNQHLNNPSGEGPKEVGSVIGVDNESSTVKAMGMVCKRVVVTSFAYPKEVTKKKTASEIFLCF